MEKPIKTGRWTKEEIEFLKENYGKMLGKDIAKKLNRTYRSIRSKAERLELYAPLSDFKNNNPAKIPFIVEKIRKFQKERWENKKSVLNSEGYRKKQRISLKQVWKRPDYLKKMRFRDEHCKNQGKIRTKEMKKRYSKSHKILWKNPNSIYNSEKFQKELGKRIDDMLQKRGKYIKNKVELKVKNIIEENKLSFNYTGNIKIKVERYFPDFINVKKKKIIEVNGDYWHNFPKVIERDKRKLQIYSLYEYQTLIIWEHEIKKDPQKVTEKIVNFYLN